MRKLFDFGQLPVIDSHCHLFNLEYLEHSLAKTLSFSLNDVPEEQLTNSLFYRKMVVEIGRFLGIHGSLPEILETRKNKMFADYPGYVENLFRDVNIHTLLIDLGYKPAFVSLADFEALVPSKVRYIYRIESVLDEIWNDKPTIKEAEEKFYQAIEEAVKELKVVALKSIIGYRTGLEIRDVQRSDFKNGLADEKAFRDYFFLRAVEKCIELNLPLQIHASFGESNLNLLHNNPLLLKSVLEDHAYNKARMVLVHGGYPYSFEAAFLAAVYPNVYLDMSEMVPFVPLGMRRGLRDYFDMCPLNKIMYGSDGFVTPEIHWLGAKAAKEEIADIFAELVEKGLFDEEYALQTARQIFFDTANAVYQLSEMKGD